ncbi:uncharacterized protein LOC129572344 [Sitodiplosis mosellana]|uniref:uncharacterized protein LOC129572344 n=1 Tax=Sitodiplosis mosellana TaxID=263140 RepID=UPI0024448F91|nr:uncharacterized protein LOC129572344 [Sitodiplosis mosellana]
MATQVSARVSTTQSPSQSQSIATTSLSITTAGLSAGSITEASFEGPVEAGVVAENSDFENLNDSMSNLDRTAEIFCDDELRMLENRPAYTTITATAVRHTSLCETLENSQSLINILNNIDQDTEGNLPGCSTNITDNVSSILGSIDVSQSRSQQSSTLIDTETSTEMSQSEELNSSEPTSESVNFSIIDSNNKTPMKIELGPFFNTCREHLEEIQNLQNVENDSQISLNFVRRLSTNIIEGPLENSLPDPLDLNPIQNRVTEENNNSEDSNIQDTDEDDCIITSVSGTVLLPLMSTTDQAADALIKRKNDCISGDIPYMEKKHGRVFKIGNRLIQIERNVVDKLWQWNTPPSNANLDLDFRFALAVFLSVVSPSDILENNIDSNSMDFVLDLMRIRSNNNAARVSAVEISIKAYCQSKQREMTENQTEKQTEK